MKTKFKATALAMLLGTGVACAKEEVRPNILWLTLEDSSPYQYGCYGNKVAKTPNIDALAREGVRFTNAYAVAPHCSPARSTLVMGEFATTYGTDYHQTPVQSLPHLFYPEYFREAGYYCVNNRKTHYNTSSAVTNKLWDKCNGAATYNSKERGENQPFFAVFNYHGTHMSRFRSLSLEGRENREDLKKLGVDVNDIETPPHVPNTIEFKSDQAMMLAAIENSDLWVKAFVDDLKKRDLYDNTIIFFYSDHGGCIPRGKGFPFESGLKVPLIIRVPEKYQAEFGIKPNSVDDRLIGFEDIAPTIMSMAGLEIPEHMKNNTVHYGKYKSKEPKKVQFAFRTNQEDFHFDPCRTATDGKFKYIRNYIPHKPFNMRNFFQWGMPSKAAWDKYVFADGEKNPDWLQPYQMKPSEMLFDLDKDPWELNNLADKPEYKATLEKFRGLVSEHIRKTKDLGFFAWGFRQKEGGLYTWVRENNFPLDTMYRAVELASSPKASDIPEIKELLKNENPEIQYWGAIAMTTLASRGEYDEIVPELRALENSDVPEVKSAAAEAMSYLGESDKGIVTLIDITAKGPSSVNFAYSALEAMTHHPKMKHELAKFIPMIEEKILNNKDVKIVIKGRSLLISLRVMEMDDLYVEKDRLAGLKVNQKEERTDWDVWLRDIEKAKPNKPYKKNTSF